jgi:hypothetical protein
MTDFDEGIMIGEILEGIFDQLAHLFVSFEISKDEKTKATDRLRDQLGSLSKVYAGKDKTTLYETLKRMRISTTRLQFDIWRTMNYKRPRISPEDIAL